MSHSGINMAVTENGAKYNKLSRPEVFIESLSTNPAPRDPAAPVEAANTKRTVDKANLNDDGSREEKPKRSRTQQRATNAESGMQSMFPGMLDEAELSDDSTTNEALAYLRSVRYDNLASPHFEARYSTKKASPNKGHTAYLCDVGPKLLRSPTSSSHLRNPKTRKKRCTDPTKDQARTTTLFSRMAHGSPAILTTTTTKAPTTKAMTWTRKSSTIRDSCRDTTPCARSWPA